MRENYQMYKEKMANLQDESGKFIRKKQEI